MLAEKFILFLESLIRRGVYADGSPKVLSTSPHVPAKQDMTDAATMPSLPHARRRLGHHLFTCSPSGTPARFLMGSCTP
jgi:hypothetical protein